MTHSLTRALNVRFSDAAKAPPDAEGNATLCALASHASVRSFRRDPVPEPLLRTLAAVALSAPSKSDLQQRDIIAIQDPALKSDLLALVDAQEWTRTIPTLLIFCANNRRLRQISDWQGETFANDHLDAFFNAAVDTGIALQAFITAAEAAGLAACPISTIRNRIADVDRLLHLPDHVFPVAGLALGWPATPPDISPRLPLAATFHIDRHADTTSDQIAAYDATRPGWSKAKARQYATPQRTDFATHIRAKGFRLD